MRVWKLSVLRPRRDAIHPTCRATSCFTCSDEEERAVGLEGCNWLMFVVRVFGQRHEKCVACMEKTPYISYDS